MSNPEQASNPIRSRLAQAYNQDAQRREAGEMQVWRYEVREGVLKRLISHGVSTLLEIGAGPGKDSRFFQDNGIKVVSTDLTYGMSTLCRQKGLLTCMADLYRLPFPAQQFDAVWSMNCLLHVPVRDLLEVLDEIRSVLRRDGLFHLGVYGGKNQEGTYEEDHLRPQRFFSFLSDERIQEFASRLFTIEAFKTIPVPENKAGLHFQSLVLRRE